jgi:hypothetical protein
MPDIEVTDEMIEAGSDAYLNESPVDTEWRVPPNEIKELVTAIFRAMRAKEREEQAALISLEWLRGEKGYVEQKLAKLNDGDDKWGTLRVMWTNRLAEINEKLARLPSPKDRNSERNHA